MKQVLKQLRENWVILIFILSCVASFTTMQNKVNAQENAQACVDKEIESLKKTCSIQNTDIAVIKNDISSIKDAVKENSNDTKKILAYLLRKNG